MSPSPNDLLVVEDEPLVRMLLVDALRDEGFEVHEAENAQDALQILNRNIAIRGVITDVIMPGKLTGLDLANWLKEHRSDVAVLVTSGYMSNAQALLAASSFPAFISKPYRISDVVAQMRAQLGHS